MLRVLARSASLLTLCTLTLLAASVAAAQTPTPSRLALRGGLAMTGTGDETNCAFAPSAAAGLEARTAGALFVALSGDLHLGLPFVCSDVATLVPYDGDRWAYEEGGSFFALAPRVGARVGIAPARWGVEPSVGGGAVLSTDLGSSRAALQPWVSGAALVRIPNRRWGVQAEYGMHRVAMRHEIHRRVGESEVHDETRHFSRWRPLFQVALQHSW